MYGGSISAILIHAPGTPAAAATLLDGYPMCKKGQAGKALSVAMFASFCGGVIGALVMTFLSPLVADMAMNFGPSEMFILAVSGCSRRLRHRDPAGCLYHEGHHPGPHDVCH